MAETIVLIIAACSGTVLLVAMAIYGFFFFQTDDRKCPICGKIFEEKEQLVHHLRWSKTCGGNGRLERKMNTREKIVNE
ncbi:MAG: C2H2-type zinc finger protein [Candidatus Izemoplasmatales bacterium]|jgi:uncharacterized C2H2 Zn-finger protein